MKQFTLGAVLGSVRQLLAIIIAVLSIAGAAYLGSHELSNPDHYAYGGCPSQAFVNHGWLLPCRPPTRSAWQTPLAITIAALGLGAAVKIAGGRPRRYVREGGIGGLNL